MNNIRILSVLMWKHAVVRQRRYIQTAIDLVIPILIFIIMFAIRNKFRPPDAPPMSSMPNTDIIRLEGDFIPPPYWIMYYPYTMLTNSLMDEVGAKLNLKRLNYTSGRRILSRDLVIHRPTDTSYVESGYFPLYNHSQMLDFAAKMKIMDAIIIFQDMTGDSWPTHLNYTIRMKGDFKTGTYQSLDDIPGPHRKFGTKYATFMSIQWAVDTSYIKLLSSEEVPQALSLQEFPYYYKPLDVYGRLLTMFLKDICWFSLFLTFVFLVVRLLLERASGIHELMKMLGVSPKLLGLSHFLNVLPCGLIFSIGGAILLTVASNPLLQHSSGFLIFLMLLLYFNTIVSLAFACSYIPTERRYATGVALLAYVILDLPSLLTSKYKLPYTVRVATGILPNVPIIWFWKELGMLELIDIGLSFSNMTKTHAKQSCSVLLCYIFMLLQAAIGYFLTWYFAHIWPGQYGHALPWNFLFKASYWKKGVVEPLAAPDEEVPKTVDTQFFEPPPANAEPGIKVVNVSKVYPKHRALSNVSLAVYKGEITVLLGHNGAGKTTLMSIITGMTSATEGKVFVNGKDTVTQQNEVRKHLGLCPQHNLFIEDLTVREHIMFSTLLKQGTYAEARKSASELAERLTLSDKLKSQPSQLSGGMKRRVQLACALAGGADVLVLDEPTSGLDVETRRKLWDLLLSLRSGRTVLLTTHFMEEADALGDRVAALQSGVLRCFATTMYLKKAVGSGYRLTLLTIGSPKEQEITRVVTSEVPDAAVKDQTINSISYSLPSAQSSKFPGLFSALEAEKSKLGIESIGVGVSTLEEAFLQLCSDIDTTLSEDEVDNVREPEVPPEKINGGLLYMRQLYVLWKRQVKYSMHKKWSFVFTQVLTPICMIVLLTSALNGTDEDQKQEPQDMNLDMFGDQADRRVMYHVDGPVMRSSDVDTVWKRYPKVAFQDADDIATEVLRTGQKDVLEYNKYLMGLEINETDAKILYTTVVRHAAPVALNLLSNMLAAQHMPWADERTITTMNDPVNRELRLSKPTSKSPPKSNYLTLFWGVMVVAIIVTTNINNVSLPCQERLTSSRHIHVMSGCPPELHWLVTLSFHTVLAALTLVLPTVLAVLVFERNQTTNQPDALATFALIMLLGSMSLTVLGYLVSFNFGDGGTGTFLVICFCIFGIFTPLMKKGHEAVQDDSSIPYRLLVVCNHIMPPHTMVEAAIKCLTVARLNAMCKFDRPLCPEISSELGLNVTKCCAGHNPRCYFCWDDFSPDKNLIIMFVQFLVMLTLVFLTERGFFNGLLDKVTNNSYKPKQPVEQDEMVRAESAYVSKAITLPAKQIPDAMLVHDLHKNYTPFCKKNVNAVRGISFSVKKGECFGLLGVNGAGKTSTFKMLIAQESATRGQIFGNGYHLTRGNNKYLQSLGYCPQFFGLDMFLTGQENLELILTMRGFDKQRVNEEVRNWIHIVGLEKYAQRRVESYSGGCMRRLGAVAAMCGGAEIALLDEPSTGVDVAARRRLWTSLRRALRQKRSIIITSHSMDEMEALCSRIAILVAGRMRVLGTADALRAAHAHGHAVRFKLFSKLQAAANEADNYKKELDQLKRQVQTTFNCTLRDEHKTMLHYHINETMRYSQIFKALESFRTSFPSLIEDYSVSETTLEEVFLSLAKEQETAAQNV